MSVNQRVDRPLENYIVSLAATYINVVSPQLQLAFIDLISQLDLAAEADELLERLGGSDLALLREQWKEALQKPNL